MSALRNPKDATAGSPPPEAFDYDDDVTAEAVEKMAALAKPCLEQDDYVLVEGYVGSK